MTQHHSTTVKRTFKHLSDINRANFKPCIDLVYTLKRKWLTY